ncbi:MAG: serine/threonine-protein kinase [Planctomycetota bacterium]|nr:serine/threonine-protein kinase [Planctomycetota bacterium]
MDLNKLQGEYLLSKQILSSEIVVRAYDELPGHSGDLCAVLIEHGFLSLAVAEQARYAAGITASGELGISNQIIAVPNLAVSSQVVPAFTENSQEIGGYRILSEIGSGGMGTVYRAYSNKLGRECALKTLRHGQEIGIEESERFRLEAETMARLDHPHIVKVFDFGEEGGIAYLAMDLVAGVTLKALLREEGVPDGKRAAEIVMKCAKALSYAHRHAILHRDVKPDNILIRQETGSPLLTDFGLAKRVGSQDEGLTQTGAVMGTPVYMSPEQALGDHEKIDQRSDIYSLGATLYELLTGEKVFPGGNFVNLVHAIVRQEPLAPRRLDTSIDKNLEIICLKCIEKAPENRYWTAEDLANDLQRFLNDETILAKPQTGLEKFRRWTRRHRSMILGAWVLGLAAILASLGAIARPVWREWNQYRSVQNVEKAVRLEATTWNLKLNADLDRIEQDIKALISSGDHSEASAQPILAALEKKIDEFVRKNVRDKHFENILDNPDYDLSPEQKQRLFERARQVLDGPALAARAASMKADLYEDMGADMKAGAQRALAYKYGPNSLEGVNSLLVLANSLCAKREYLRANIYYRKLSNNSIFGEARSKAYLGLAEIYVNKESFGRALTILEDKIDWAVLNKKEQSRGNWLKSLALGLRGRLKMRLPKNFYRPVFHYKKKAVCFRVNKQSDGSQVTALSIDIKKGKANFSELSSLSIPGELTDFRQVRGSFGQFIVLKYKTPEQQFLRYYQFSTGRLKLLWEPKAADVFIDYEALAIGDMDGNGKGDVFLNTGKQRILILNFASDERRAVPLERTEGSYVGQASFHDFDRDGCDELFLTLIEWNHYSAHIYKGQKNLRGAQRDWRSELLGRVTGVLVVPGEETEILLSADRRKSHDIGVIFGADLKPDRPDAIWRWYPKEGAWALEALLRAPFDERERCKISLVGLLTNTVKGFPGAYVYKSNVAFKKAQWVIDSRKNDWQLRWDVETAEQMYCFDIDGDGDNEVIRVQGQRFIIDGIEELGKERVEDELEADLSLDQYELGLTLLESGQANQAKILFEELLSEPNRKFSKPYIQLAIARCFIQLKNYRRARQLCLEVDRTAPAFGREALSLATDCAEQTGDYRAALSDLNQLEKSYSFSASKREKLLKRKQGLSEMGRFKTVIDLNNILNNQKDLNVELSDHHYFQFDKDHLRVFGHHFDEASLAIPVNYNGQSFRLNSVLNIEQLDGSAEFRMALMNNQKELFFIRLIWAGSGDPSAWRSWLKIGTDRPLISIDCDWFDPKEVLNFTVTYRADRSELQVSYEYQGIQKSLVAAVPLSIPKGNLRFVVGNREKKLSASFFNLTRRAVTRVKLQSLSVSAAPETFVSQRRADPRWRLGRSEMLSALGEDDAALVGCLELIDLRKKGKWLRSAHFKAALSAFRLGRQKEGLEQLSLLQDLDRLEKRAYFPDHWRHVFFTLSQPERVGLAAFFGVKNRDMALNRLSQLNSQGLDPFRIALLLSILGEESNREEVAGAWFRVGDYKRASQCLAKSNSERLRFFQGILAYQNGEFQKAIADWKAVRGGPPVIKNQVKAYSILMENRLLKRAKRKEGTR